MMDATGLRREGSFRLRMGVMCAGATLESWQADCVRQILSLGFVTPELLIVDAGAESRSWVQRVRTLPLHEAAFILWTKYLFPPRSRARVPLGDVLAKALASRS